MKKLLLLLALVSAAAAAEEDFPFVIQMDAYALTNVWKEGSPEVTEKYVTGFGGSFTSFSDEGHNGVQVFYEQNFEDGVSEEGLSGPVVMRLGFAYVRRLNPLGKIEVSVLFGGSPFFTTGGTEETKNFFGLSAFVGMDFLIPFKNSNTYLTWKNRGALDLDRAVENAGAIGNRLRYTPALGFGLHY